jgi:2-octaprenylphenol hydroxylase
VWLVWEGRRLADVGHYDVSIIGAGIAGSALAVALRDQGLSIALVEAQSLACPGLPAVCDLDHFDPRVSALTPRSRAFLEQLGAWEAIAAYRHCAYDHMTVWDAQGTGQIEFDGAEVNASELGYIVENRSIVSALQGQLAAAADITRLSPVTVQACERLDSSRLSLLLDGGDSIETKLVVAADGALSQVRQMMEFATREWDYGHHALVCTVEVSQSHENTAWQSFSPSGPLALLPLPGEKGRHYCSIVWSQKESVVEDLLALDNAAFCTALERASEGKPGAVLGCSSRFAFPLRQRHAVDYVQSGVALVADAAHTIHPLAGQGINLGLQDVAVLAQEILAGLARDAQPGQLDVLRRYQRRRKGENLLMMTAMDGFKHLFEEEALPLRWLRNAGMRTVNGLLPVKRQLMRHAMGLG